MKTTWIEEQFKALNNITLRQMCIWFSAKFQMFLFDFIVGEKWINTLVQNNNRVNSFFPSCYVFKSEENKQQQQIFTQTLKTKSWLHRILLCIGRSDEIVCAALFCWITANALNSSAVACRWRSQYRQSHVVRQTVNSFVFFLSCVVHDFYLVSLSHKICGNFFLSCNCDFVVELNYCYVLR